MAAMGELSAGTPPAGDTPAAGPAADTDAAGGGWDGLDAIAPDTAWANEFALPERTDTGRPDGEAVVAGEGSTLDNQFFIVPGRTDVAWHSAPGIFMTDSDRLAVETTDRSPLFVTRAGEMAGDVHVFPAYGSVVGADSITTETPQGAPLSILLTQDMGTVHIALSESARTPASWEPGSGGHD